MGIFKTFDNVDLAYQLFGSQGVGAELSALAKKELKKCPTRQDVLIRAIELCNGFNSPEALYVISYCYVWLGAKYRKQAIEWLEKYIAAGAICRYTPIGHVKMNGYTVNQKSANISDVYSNLGKAYEGEYIFDKAKEAYAQAVKYAPYFPSSYVFYAKVLVKENNLEAALDYLKSQRKVSYYSSSDDFNSIIEAEIADVIEKQNKGYVYKPRKKKEKIK